MLHLFASLRPHRPGAIGLALQRVDGTAIHWLDDRAMLIVAGALLPITPSPIA